ncbi:MAG: ABC transporter permease [Actinomycetota bacterium]
MMTAIDDPGSEASDSVADAPIDVPNEVAELDAAMASAAVERKRIRAERRRLLFRTPGFIIGLVIVGFWVLCAIAPGLIAPYDGNEAVRVDGNVIAREGPSTDAWFGTDTIGNDVFSRVIFGARNVLIMAPAAAAIAAIAGTFLGLLVGFYRGWVDEVISRIAEAFLSIPVILLGIMTLVVFGNSRFVIILTVATLFTPVVTRTVRSAVLAEAQLDYVTSAKLRGESGPFIMLREILPNVTGVIVVEFTVRVGYAIFTIATLAFLGLASDDFTTPDWGGDIANTYDLIQSNQWWPTIFPALAIASLVIAVNLIADSLDKVRSA